MFDDLGKQAVGALLSLLPPTFFALIGRLAHYANLSRFPSVRETIFEAIIVVFMGIFSGGVGQYIGLTGPVLWAFISSMSFFGPKMVHTFFGRFFGKNDFESCDLNIAKSKKKKK